MQEIVLCRPKGQEKQAVTPIRMGGRLRLGELLVKAGLVSEGDVARALTVQRTGGGRLGATLISLRLCKEEDIRKVLREQLGVEVVNLKAIKPDAALIDLLTLDLIRKYEVIPLRREGRTLWVAMKDPYNLVALDDIRFRTGIPSLVVAICTEQDFKQFIEEHFEAKALFDEIINGRDFFNRALNYLQNQGEYEVEEEVTPEQAHHLRLASTESPIVTLCNFIMMDAIRRQASDIHFEPHETAMRVRLRIDGRLQTFLNPPKRLHPAIVARFKVMSEMDITKRRIPQDGHLAVAYRGETIHFRVSTLPTIYGEKCVVRLLKKSHSLIDFEHLGLAVEARKVFTKALHAPQGLILVTGPTGSGKTTTLHAGLACLNNSEINVLTLEDPVEATLTGINHVPVSKLGGVSFTDGLKAILRQDPDVIFIGEIRDIEVASIALRAAQTGHLVLSTLHTNSAVESINRLIDLGIPPYVLSGSLLLVMAQRLLRRICESCAEADEPADELLAALGLERGQLAGARLRRGRGCPECTQTGYRGRVAVYEMLRVNKELRTLIHDQASAGELLDNARGNGLRPLFEAALEKVVNGETTLAEMQRVLIVED